MASIDDRIVNMQFNNAQFQQGISETNASLEQLQNNLKLNGAGAGFDAAQAAANRFSLANIEQSLANVASKFSIFGVSAFTIIQELTKNVLGFGAQIGNALVEPIFQGGERRALALQKAEFQFRGLGLDVEATMEVAKQSVLDTAFSLDQAATAASILGTSGVTVGHGLEGALRGIAGVAAQTGSSYSEIADIFSNVSGQTRLMGDDLLRLSSRGVNAAAILATQMGKSEATVRDMVSEGKISFQEFSDAMGNAFGDNAKKANELFTGALANMNSALSRLGGKFEGPKLLNLRDIFNAMSPLINDVSTALDPLINAFNEIQNSTAATVVEAISKLLGPGLVISIQNIVQAILSIGKAISGGFGEIFPSDTAAQLTAVSNFLQDFTAALIPGTKAAAELQRTFAGVFAVFSILGQIIGTVIKTFFDLIGVAAPAGGTFLEITAKIGDFLVKVDAFLKKGQYIQTFFSTLGGFIAVPIAILREFFGIIGDGIENLNLFNGAGKGLEDFADDVASRFKGLAELGNFFNTVWTGVLDIAQAVWGFLKPIFVGIGQVIGDSISNLKEGLAGLSFDDTIKVMNTGIFGAFLLVVRGFFGHLGGVISGNGVAFVTQFKIIMGSITSNLKALELNTNVKTLTQIAIAVALLAASAIALSLVDPARLGLALGAIAGLMTSLIGAFTLFGKVGGTMGIFESAALSTALIGIATSILILSAAVAILGAMPLANLVQGVVAITVLLGVLSGTMLLLGKSAPQVLAGAAAIAILVPPLVLLSGVIAILGVLPLPNLVQGVGAVIVVLVALTGVMLLLGKSAPQVLLGAAAIALIAPALALLTGAVAALGALPFLNVLQGVGALVVMLAAISGAILLLGLSGPAALLGAVAISAVTLSMVPLIGAIALLGAIPFDNLLRGMIAFGAALVILTGVVLLLGFTGPVAVLGAAALVAVAVAISVLAPALRLLSTISWDEFGKLMATLSAGLSILAVMGILLIPASVGFLLLGTAILLIGTGIGAAAAGIGLLVVGLGALVAIGTGVFGILGFAIDALIQKLPALGTGIGQAIVAMAVVIGQSAPQLIEAFVQLLLAMLDAIGQVVPEIIVTATDIIVTLVDALVILIPLLVDAGLQIVAGILEGIANNIGEITTQASNIMINFLNALAEKLPDIITAAGNVVLSFINGISSYIKNNAADFVTAGSRLFRAIVNGVALAIEQGGSDLRYAGQRIGNALFRGAMNAIGAHSPSRRFRDEFMGAVFSGIELGNTQNIDRAGAAGSDIGEALGSNALTSMQSTLTGLGDAFASSDFDINPTITPVIDMTNINNASKQLPGLLQAPSLSLGTTNGVATSVSLQEQARNAQIVFDMSKMPLSGNSDVTFIQNNTSPKALSEIELYRQTSNLISAAKGGSE